MAYKLLLADDSITIQKVVELVLAEEDFQIKSVGNGEDALKVIGDFVPDVVLADIEMPKMNGYQLCDRIKKNPATRNVPVILLAGAFEPIDNELSRSVGADDSVIKPFESQELISKINAVLAMGSAIPAVEEEAIEEGVAVAEEAVEEGEAAEVFEMAEAEEAVAAAAPAEEDLWSMEEAVEPVESAATVEEEVSAMPEPVSVEEAFAEAEESVLTEAPEEAAAFEEVAVVAPPEPEPEMIIPAMPAKAERPVTVSAPQVSSEDVIAACRQSVDRQVALALSSLDLKETIMASLVPLIRETLEKVLWEIAPELTEKVLKEVIKGSVASLGSQVEKVIWETVPDLASSMITKEIEKIKAEF